MRGRPALAGFAGALLLLLAGSEIGGRLAARRGTFYGAFDVTGSLTSVAEVKDRVLWAGRIAAPTALLGDSVLGATALRERGDRDAKSGTVTSQLAVRESARGGRLLSLSADGLLVPDLLALAREVAPARPGRVLLILNVRMFASEFEGPGQALSRPFLAESLPEAERAALAVARAPLEDTLFSRAARLWCFFRQTQLLRALWYTPDQRAFHRRLVERLFPPEDAPDLHEAAARLKAEPYYERAWRADGAPLRTLPTLLAVLGAAAPRVDVVLAPQNGDVTAAHAEVFEANRSVLARVVAAAAVPGLVYHDWSGRFGPAAFLDHCHLGRAGNLELADALFRLGADGG